MKLSNSIKSGFSKAKTVISNCCGGLGFVGKQTLFGGGGITPPITNDFILLETGDFILLETGDKIIKET
jgi:hypothetical protein